MTQLSKSEILTVLQEQVEVSVCLISVVVHWAEMNELCGLVSITGGKTVNEYCHTEYLWL